MFETRNVIHWVDLVEICLTCGALGLISITTYPGHAMYPCPLRTQGKERPEVQGHPGIDSLRVPWDAQVPA